MFCAKDTDVLLKRYGGFGESNRIFLEKDTDKCIHCLHNEYVNTIVTPNLSTSKIYLLPNNNLKNHSFLHTNTIYDENHLR